jgi:hypothetical protein
MSVLKCVLPDTLSKGAGQADDRRYFAGRNADRSLLRQYDTIHDGLRSLNIDFCSVHQAIAAQAPRSEDHHHVRDDHAQRFEIADDAGISAWRRTSLRR